VHAVTAVCLVLSGVVLLGTVVYARRQQRHPVPSARREADREADRAADQRR
jgi:hypothetical protein